MSSTKPIIFETKMVKAILDGRKTQTRIPVKIKNKLTRDWALSTGVEWIKVDLKDEKYPYSIREQNGAWNEYSLKDFINKYSQYKIGDILYVREKSYFVDCDCQCPWQCSPQGWYATDEVSYSGIRCSVETIPSIHMRKEHARIFLKVTNVRVERLQDIILDDIEKEGFSNLSGFFHHDLDNALEWWEQFWNSTAKDGYKWEDNPYVFVYEFERVLK